jgi:hypothetical protein
MIPPNICNESQRFDGVHKIQRIFSRYCEWMHIPAGLKVAFVGHSPPPSLRDETLGTIRRFCEHHQIREFCLVNLFSCELKTTKRAVIPVFDQNLLDANNFAEAGRSMVWADYVFAAWGSRHLHGAPSKIIMAAQSKPIRYIARSASRGQPYHFHNWKVDPKKASFMLKTSLAHYPSI